VADLRLTLATASYDRVRPLADGSVKADGIELDVRYSAPSETFYKMLKFDEFDISEMSFSSYLIARSQGREWTAIPVFPFRNLFHLSIYRHPDNGVAEPKDLHGKRFGLTEYQVTAALWTRGALQHDFDVDLTKIRWFVERTPEMSHGGVTGFAPPPGISIERIPEEETLQSLLDRGELDAILPSPYPGMKSRLNRTDEMALADAGRARRLFASPREEARRYLRRNRFLHVNHTVVIRNEILDEHPWVAENLYRAFRQAKAAAYAQLDYLRRSSLVFSSVYLEEERELLGADPFPYGIEANRRALDTLFEYSFEQGFIPRKPSLESLFAASTLST
jgi:4,5-dihydroxyphthalate decarboxylase